ncbi:Avr1b-1 Avirulence-like protein [Phytophthora palmivora]|uniref:RxLR effector protein n=1 Tax=Phytophthora palmivora TaxID=4796 RepID=A0A2P4XEP5_9STRA|nr:Avr1b-1 Avirulence-like protein [Phytophthora palmivora]
MNLKCIVLIVGATHLAIIKASTTAQAELPKVAVDTVIAGINTTRFLTNQEAANEEIRDVNEERLWNIKALFGSKNFAKADLEKMSKSESFKLSKFKEWDKLKTEKIIKRLKNSKYNVMLLEYLNRRSAAIRAGTFKRS